MKDNRTRWHQWLETTLLYNPVPSWLDKEYFSYLGEKILIFSDGDADLEKIIWEEVVSIYGRKLEYKRYLSGGYWQNLRAYKLASVGFRCENCGAERALQVHHKRYGPRGSESLVDLRVLCDDCHSRSHHDATHFGDEL